jgi:hypothetical protein
MKRALLILLLAPLTGFSQFTTVDLAPMPVTVANNAVTENEAGTAVYSFSGIDETKTHDGIHLHSYKYDVALDSWSTLADLPDTMGKIAAGASVVKDRIYIIGGYHVLANGNEVSSDKVHVLNTTTDLFEADALNIPVPIDDHVQAVWRDSLIYVVTCWSNSGNVPDVQIFNPALNTWEAGTSVVNNIQYTSFGATGKIIGDTLYYYGGTSGSFSFAARNYLRKGVINPLDPTDITWTKLEDAPETAGYRCASAVHNNSLLIIGGSSVAYNYDGIAYNGSGGVSPSGRILEYDAAFSTYSIYQFLPELMDFRGEAKISNNEWITCGGMGTGQAVSNRTVKYTLSGDLGIENESKEIGFQKEGSLLKFKSVDQVYVTNMIGQTIFSGKVNVLDLSQFNDKIVLVSYFQNKQFTTTKVFNN